MMWFLVLGDPRQFLYAPPHETKDCIAVLEPLTNGWRVTMPVTESRGLSRAGRGVRRDCRGAGARAMRVSSGTGKQYVYDDKAMIAVIEPLADGTWRAVKSGKVIGVYDSRAEAIAAVMDERGRP